jgi:hypothetical protein
MNSSKFNAKIYNTMKHRLLLPLILACSTWQSYAEDIDVVYMITTLNSGTTKEIMLSNDTSFVGPKLFNKENRLIIDGKSYTPDDIQEIRFEKRTIDAIVTVESQVDIRNKDNAVYNLNGQKVCDIETFESQRTSLPKGIYVINGKKFIKK